MTGRPSQASTLVRLVLERTELLHTPDGEGFAVVAVPGQGEHPAHHEVHSLKSRGMQRRMAALFQEEEDRAPSAQAVTAALLVLEGRAMRAPEAELHLRLADGGINDIYLDLGGENRQAVRVDRAGWRIVESQDCPVYFRRPTGMLPLSQPERGGSLEDLRGLLNVGDPETWILIVAWLVGAMRPRGPYPILLLQGEQGAAKSTAARTLRALIDPYRAALRAAPRDERDLAIAARNSWVLALDNLSGLPGWLSDALCRLATGGGWATRELYSDSEEVIFESQRPVVMTGIDNVASRGDLLDRCIVVTLPAIADQKRRTEAELAGEFARLRPRLLAALLDAMSMALDREETVQLDRQPRMADFGRWVAAAEPALPWPEGHFLDAYAEARAGAVGTLLEGSLVAQAVLDLARVGGFRGTASELLERLEKDAPEARRRNRYWPRSARALGGELRRLAPALRLQGIEVSHSREARRRLVAITAGGDGGVTMADDERHCTTPRDFNARDGSDGCQPFGSTAALLSEFQRRGVRLSLSDSGLVTEPPPFRLPRDLFELLVRRQGELRSALGGSL